MSDDGRSITVDMIHQGIDELTRRAAEAVDPPAPVCEWPRLCGDGGCRFPRYLHHGQPHGLLPTLLLHLGYPLDLLQALDCEYEIGEILHPGVKVRRSRNPALGRFDRKGIALLGFLQENTFGSTWSHISTEAFRPRWMIPFLDARRRPWLY